MKEVKEFIEMMNKRASYEEEMAQSCESKETSWYEGRDCLMELLKDTPEYQALKASISPVSEDKPHTKKCLHLQSITDGKTGVGCDECGGFWSMQEWAMSEQPTDHIPDCTKMVDKQDNGWEFEDYGGYGVIKPKQDNDGWIANPGKCPVPRETTVEVRWEGGDTHKDKAYYFRWSIRQNEYDIIAYRIIEEPKEQKKKCYHLFKLRADFNGECDKCGEPISRETVGQTLAKEPKRQTLWDAWALKYPVMESNEVNEKRMEDMRFISEYLEMKNN